MASKCGTVQLHISQRKHQKLVEKLCSTLLYLHTCIRGASRLKFDMDQKKMIIAGVYLSLNEVFLINSETKMTVLYEAAGKNTCSSLLRDTLERMSLITDRIRSANNSR